ncbi:hypothetical protein CSUI_008011, partial [Cystoisospora suis]
TGRDEEPRERKSGTRKKGGKAPFCRRSGLLI